jgi:hypothetical protein
MGVRDMRRFIRYIQEMQAAFLGLGLCFSPAFVRASDTTSIQEVMVERNWQEVKMGPGKCSMKFPNQPEHVSETMQMEGVEFSLQYDAFIASSDTKAIFMLLVAQYPDFVDEQFAHASLEAFLNGILTHNPNNQLFWCLAMKLLTFLSVPEVFTLKEEL